MNIAMEYYKIVNVLRDYVIFRKNSEIYAMSTKRDKIFDGTPIKIKTALEDIPKGVAIDYIEAKGEFWTATINDDNEIVWEKMKVRDITESLKASINEFDNVCEDV